MNHHLPLEELFKLFDEMDLYKAYGIKRVGVFGSFARGEGFNDIDLYIEEDIHYGQLKELKNRLEMKTGIPLDIMTKKYAEPVILHRAMKEMLYATPH